jgi:hypothetical protein
MAWKILADGARQLIFLAIGARHPVFPAVGARHPVFPAVGARQLEVVIPTIDVPTRIFSSQHMPSSISNNCCAS